MRTIFVLAFVAFTFLAWGVYGPVLHVGQDAMGHSSLRPFTCVGLAYFLVAVVVPIEAVILMLWWFWVARESDPEGWLDPFRPESVGTVLVQWAVAIVAIFIVQKWLRSRLQTQPSGTG